MISGFLGEGFNFQTLVFIVFKASLERGPSHGMPPHIVGTCWDIGRPDITESQRDVTKDSTGIQRGFNGDVQMSMHQQHPYVPKKRVFNTNQVFISWTRCENPHSEVMFP